MERIARSVLRCSFVQKVVLCNNNPDLDIQEWLGIADRRLVVINQQENRGTVARFEISRRDEGDYFLAIDDDIFLTPQQIRRLFRHLLKDPSVPHGLYGQVAFENQEFIDWDLIHGIEGRVDIINKVYGFTKAHVLECFRLLGLLGVENRAALKELTMGDDIVLSFSGQSSPLCHHLGDILSCPTESLPGLAVWREPGFVSYRATLLARLRKVKCFQPAGSLPPLAALVPLPAQTLFNIDGLNDQMIHPQAQPVIVSNDTPVFVNGWALDARAEELAGGVYLDIDGRLYPAFYGTDRKDVADHFNIPRYRYSGFARPISDLVVGRHSLSIIILTKGREAYYKPSQTLAFELK